MFNPYKLLKPHKPLKPLRPLFPNFILTFNKIIFSMTEEEILDGSKKNNAAAQELLYQKYSPKMLGVCYRFAKSKMDAEDMLQEGFIKVFTQLNQYRNSGSLEGWIRRIIVNTCINVLKKNKRFSDCLDISIAENLHSLEKNIPSIIQAKQIVECIRLLPIGYRTVLNLYAIEGYSHKEIGALLDIQESSSRSQYFRAKAMLEIVLVKNGILDQTKKELA
jgi:RNA polymerase sigma-70 factor (ECF subfamily)